MNTEEKVVPFKTDKDHAEAAHAVAQACAGDSSPAAVAMVAEPPAPWETAAESLAAEAYRLAHGLGAETPADPAGEHKARMAMIARLLSPELKGGMQAALAWAGISLYLQQIQLQLRELIAGAEVHAPSQGRHNARVLVYADRLNALVDVMRTTPKGHAEATAWWQERQQLLEDMGELPRIIALCEREMGGAPEAAEGHRDVEKIEGMLLGLLGVVAKQKQQLDKRREQVTKLSNEVARHVRR